MSSNVGLIDPTAYAKIQQAPLARAHDGGGVRSADHTDVLRGLGDRISTPDLRSALHSPSVRETIPGATVYSGPRPANNRPGMSINTGMSINSSPIIDSNNTLGLS